MRTYLSFMQHCSLERLSKYGISLLSDRTNINRSEHISNHANPDINFRLENET